VVGAKGFEPSTSWSRTRRASQAALRPDIAQERDSRAGIKNNTAELARPDTPLQGSQMRRKRQKRQEKAAGEITPSGGNRFDRSLPQKE
jgi:hypothetical protein